MGEHRNRPDTSDWEDMPPNEVLAAVVYDLYNPVSLLSMQLNRLSEDETPLTEDDYDAIFEQMQAAVRQLSKTVVSLKRYAQSHSEVPLQKEQNADH